MENFLKNEFFSQIADVKVSTKGVGSQTGIFGLVFAKKTKTIAVLPVIFFFYLNTYVLKIYKYILPKGNEEVRFGIQGKG